MGKFSASSAVFALFVASCSAKNPFIASTLGSNMVLQRGKNSTIYGWTSAANTTVTCSLNGQEYIAKSSPNSTADDSFLWECTFPPFDGGFNAYNINVTAAATQQSVLLKNVVFGDVFMCSGEGNMEFSMAATSDADTEIADADNYPNIRILSVGTDETSPNTGVPLDDLWSVSLPWSIGSAAVMQDSSSYAFDYFSAVCYEAGKNIFTNALKEEIPVGLVSSNWAGSSIATWMPAAFSDACKNTVADEQSPNRRLSEDNDDATFTTTPAVNYNNMIYPFKDMDFAGILWYQGESDLANQGIYPCLQQNLLDAWHGLGEGWTGIPLLYVQLSAWTNNGDTAIADMRWSQYTIVMDDSSEHFLVTAADLGDPDSPEGSQYPRYKSEVGRRLSLAASSAIYGNSVPHMGPLPLAGDALDDGSFGAYLKFDPSSIGDGLSLKDAQACPDEKYCGYHYLIYPTAGKVLVDQSTITMDGNTLNMYPSTAQSEKPTGIEYGYGDYPLLTIYNSYDLPLMGFATDFPIIL